MKYLSISNDVKIPMNVVTKRLAFLGTTGSGKSYAAMKLAEELLLNGIQTIIFDPVGIHWGLRLSADKKGAGISINVFGGLYGDIPITPNSGSTIADVIIDKKISAVVDVSQFEYDTDKARFASAFAQRFFYRKKANPSPVHIMLEEAQEFIPQNPAKGEEQMLHSFVRMTKIGRNFGIGISIISQRPQEVNKKALNLSQCVFAFQTSGHHERKAIDDWVRDKGLDLDIAADLPKLPIGQPHLWSPGWLGISHKIKISKRVTFHPSEEETISYESGKLNKLSPVDIAKLSESIKETIEKAKENDPTELKKQVKELQSQVKKLESQPKSEAIVTDADIELKVKVFKKEMLRRGKIADDKIQYLIEYLLNIARSNAENSQKMLALIEKANIPQVVTELEQQELSKPAQIITKNIPEQMKSDYRLQDKTPKFQLSKGAISVDEELKLGACERAICGFLLTNSDRNWTKEQVGIMTGYSPNSGGFNNSLSKLGTMKLIFRDNGKLQWSGIKAPAGINTDQVFSIDNIRRKIGKCENEILDVVIRNNNKAMSKEEVASQTSSNYSPGSGGFNNSLSKLGTLGLIKRMNGSISLSDEAKELL